MLIGVDTSTGRALKFFASLFTQRAWVGASIFVAHMSLGTGFDFAVVTIVEETAGAVGETGGTKICCWPEGFIEARTGVMDWCGAFETARLRD